MRLLEGRYKLLKGNRCCGEQVVEMEIKVCETGVVMGRIGEVGKGDAEVSACRVWWCGVICISVKRTSSSVNLVPAAYGSLACSLSRNESEEHLQCRGTAPPTWASAYLPGLTQVLSVFISVTCVAEAAGRGGASNTS